MSSIGLDSSDEFNLARFVKAQEPTYEIALREIQAGRKKSHWMWYIFPQIVGLGGSETSRYFGIASLAEAESYLAHPLLGARLIECAAASNVHSAIGVRRLFGYPDCLKFHSSMTLFNIARRDCIDVADSIRCFFGDALDERTVELIKKNGPS